MFSALLSILRFPNDMSRDHLGVIDTAALNCEPTARTSMVRLRSLAEDCILRGGRKIQTEACKIARGYTKQHKEKNGSE